jgi:hypothetical protein
MIDWKHGDKYGQTVVVADRLEKRDFISPESRRAGAIGIVIGHSDGHGLCFEVRHLNGHTAWYDPDELKVIPDYWRAKGRK